MIAVYPKVYLDFVFGNTPEDFLDEGTLVPFQVFRNERVRYTDDEFVLFIPDAVRFR